jgi:microcystin-dependent protein
MSGGLQVWSQTAASNSNADSTINWAEGQAPSSVNDSARALMASMAKWRDDNNGTLATTGSSAAFVVTSNQTAAALTDGYSIALKFHATTDTSATLALDGLTAKPIQIRGGVNVSFGQLRAGSIRRFTYSSTGTGQWILHDAPSPKPGTLVPAAYASGGNDELACDGTGYSRTTYADLFAALGTTFGSSDSSTFKVPDTTGRVLAGKEASATRLTTASGGVDGGTLGAVGGTQTHQLTLAQLASHNHGGATGGQSADHTHTTSVPQPTFSCQGGGLSTTFSVSPVTSSGASNDHTHSIASAGSDSAHPNVQPTIVVNHFIKI